MNRTTQGLTRAATQGLAGVVMLGAALLGTATPAAAQARTFGLAPAAATSGPPPRFLDEASLRVDLNTGGSSEGYKFRVTVTGQVHGRALQQADAMRLDYKVGTRVLATVRCSIEGWDGFQWPNRDGYSVGTFSCMTEQVIDSAEDATIQLTYLDDEDDRQIAFRPLQITVGASGNFTYGTEHDLQNYVNNHGLVGASTIWLREEPFGNGPKVLFTFWANPLDAARRPDDVSLRCTLNGERIRENITVAGTMMHGRGGNTASYLGQDRTNDNFGYTYYELATGFAYAGRGGQGDRYDLATHPGNYACQVRVAGTPVREFLFTVAANGSVAPHPEQLGEGALYLTPGRVLVDTRLPTPDQWDRGFDPAAIRAGSFFGRPWRDVSSLSAMMAALPAAVVGTLDPTPPPAGATIHGFSRPAAGAGRAGSSRGGSAGGGGSSMSSMSRMR
jgi:hypothetical protein